MESKIYAPDIVVDDWDKLKSYTEHNEGILRVWVEPECDPGMLNLWVDNKNNIEGVMMISIPKKDAKFLAESILLMVKQLDK